MAELPRHPDTDDQSVRHEDRRSSRHTARAPYVLAIIAVVAVLGMLVLHLAGVVGPAAH